MYVTPKIIKTRNDNVHENKSRKSDAHNEAKWCKCETVDNQLPMQAHNTKTVDRQCTGKHGFIVFFIDIYDPYFMY